MDLHHHRTQPLGRASIERVACVSARLLRMVVAVVALVSNDLKTYTCSRSANRWTLICLPEVP